MERWLGGPNAIPNPITLILSLPFNPDPQAARVILCDQISRGAFRGTPDAFAFSDEAERLSMEIAVDGSDTPEALTFPERWFMVVALMHSEDMALQEEMMARARRILADYPDLAEEIEPGIEFAKGHYDVVERFGRYPHRNKALGRESTAEELEFLAQPDLPGWMMSQG
mmetsp:Transcript_22562/g.69899  ORF Transcript_22562/g.69899 Transcript_22562/m.69899 type:complete len:169 (-) Transcript_22562:109-615(-)